MALIVLGVLVVFTTSNFQFHQVKVLWLHCHLDQWIIGFGHCWTYNTYCNKRQKQFLNAL